jgi:hypothetical protein
MLRWLTEERPDTEFVFTTTDATNCHMIDVNLAVGFETVRTMVWAETTPARLAEVLATRPDAGSRC